MVKKLKNPSPLSVAEVGDFFDSGVVQPLRLTWIGSENIYKKNPENIKKNLTNVSHCDIIYIEVRYIAVKYNKTEDIPTS